MWALDSEDNICPVSTNPAYTTLSGPIATGTFFPQFSLAAPLSIAELVAATRFGAGPASRSLPDDLVTDNSFMSASILSVGGPNNRKTGWASAYWIALRSLNFALAAG